MASSGWPQQQVVQPLEDGGRLVAVERVGLERVGLERRPHPSHQRRCPQPPADDVADGEPDAPIPEVERVVPVAAHLHAGPAGEVAHRDRGAGDARRRVAQQAALERLGDVPLPLEEPIALDGDRDPVAHELEEGGVVVAEVPPLRPPYVEHAEHVAAREQRHTEDRADAGLGQPRLERGGCLDLIERDRCPTLGDPAREAAGDRVAVGRQCRR
jgi:hypothetical protein